MSYIVYRHISPEGKVYIGITNNISARWCAGYGYRDNPEFFADIQKFGWNNFTHMIHHDCVPKEEAEKIEEAMIREAKSTNPEYGYNRYYSAFHSRECAEEERMRKRITSPLNRSVQKLDIAGRVIKEYPSISMAVQDIGGCSPSLSACLKGRMKTYKGFEWRYTPTN